ncbi:hypothetical protein H0H92_004005 [Tricholoma furcatifolium]|nr:hypothetical protein H0H92_004005 [Tricholoma furcatifolium]
MVLPWEVDQNNRLSVSLRIEGLDTKTADASETKEGLKTKTANLSAINNIQNASASNSIELDPTQQLIVSTLEIAPALLDRKKRDIRLAFLKYEAYLETCDKIRNMIKSGTWISEMPSNDTIKGIFFAVSTFAKYYRDPFEIILKSEKFNDIVSWLRSDSTGSHIDIWGNRPATIGSSLVEIIEERKSDDEDERPKRKGKKKESDDEDGKSKRKGKKKETDGKKSKSHKRK